MNITVANITISVLSQDFELDTLLSNRYHDFLSTETPDLFVEITSLENTAPETYLEIEKNTLEIFLAGEFDNKPVGITLLGPPIVTEFPDKTLFLRKDFAGTISANGRLAKLILRNNAIPDTFDAFMRICFSQLAIMNNGLMLHAAGISRNGKGFLLPGISRTGKTTLANFAKNTSIVLSDEIIFVRKENRFFTLFGSPFFGRLYRHGENSSEKLHAILFPKKDTKHELTRISAKKALSSLLATTVFFSKRLDLSEAVLTTAQNILDVIPSYKLHFKKNAGCLKLMDNL